MTLPPSRLLVRLNAEIAAESNPFRADLRRAERAAYLARQGHAKEAREDLALLHRRHDARPTVEMSAWISLAEGLLGYFGDPSQHALDKMRRACALSTAAGLSQLQALSSAWLAQLDYLRLDLPAMSKNLVCALKLADKDNHSAHARAALVMAQGFHTAERLDLALPWYERSRVHAVDHGDDATVSALMHNMAWIRTTNMRNAALTGSGDGGEGEHALAAAESTWAYDKLTGATSLDSSVPLLHAQILLLQGKFKYALALYEQHIPGSVDQGLGRLQGLLLADQAWCRLQMAQHEEAKVDAERALHLLQDQGNCDDRAPGYARLAQVFHMLGDGVSANQCEAAAVELWKEHSAMCLKLASTLEAIASDAAALH